MRPADTVTVLNDLVRLAALLAQVPTVAVALASDTTTQFRAKTGLETASEPAAYALQGTLAADHPGELHEVADLTKHPALAHRSDKSVTGDWRFAATLPLVAPNGLNLGTLVLFDTRPHHLSAAQKDGLLCLARLAAAALAPMAETAPGPTAPPATDRPEVFIKQDQRLVRLPAADIHYVEALGDYVNLHTESMGRVTIYATMKQMELKLPIAHFARIHRKYIARLDRIVAIDGDVVQIATSQPEQPAEIAIGNSYKANLLNRLNIL